MSVLTQDYICVKSALASLLMPSNHLHSMCHSELTREFNTPIVRIVQNTFARTTEAGSRTIVYGASLGPESHGQYVPDCKIGTPVGVCQKQEAGEIQTKLWEELKEKLEAIQLDVTKLA